MFSEYNCEKNELTLVNKIYSQDTKKQGSIIYKLYISPK